MMNEPFGAYAGEPVDIAEWEDLLVRFEIMPRVLRNTLETLPAGDADARAELLRLLARETWAADAFAALREGQAASAPPSATGAPDPGGDLETLAVRIGQWRAKNFAQVQRRGLEVWGWTAPLGESGRVSTFQLLCGLVAGDVRALAELRAIAGDGANAC